MRLLVGLALGLSPALFLATGSGPSFDAEIAAQVTAKRGHGGRLLVRPSLDDEPWGWFLVDTGATRNVVSLELAERKQLERLDVTTTLKSLTQTEEVQVFRAQTLALGPATWRNVSFVATDLSYLSEVMGRPVAGILGNGLFLKAAVELDLKAGSLSLHDPKTWERPEGYRWERLEKDLARPRLRAEFEEHEGDFLLDTGSSGTVTLYSDTVRELELLKDRKTRNATSSGLHDGHIYLRLGELETFAFAGEEFEDVDTSFSLAMDGPFVGGPTGQVGCGMLERFEVILDYPRERVGFRRRGGR